MSNLLTPVDLQSLESVTGGASTKRCGDSSSNDALLQQLTSLSSSIKDISSNKSSGFSNTEVLMLGLLMSQRNSQVNVVVRRPFW